jgi:hypothetical protein
MGNQYQVGIQVPHDRDDGPGCLVPFFLILKLYCIFNHLLDIPSIFREYHPGSL